MAEEPAAAPPPPAAHKPRRRKKSAAAAAAEEAQLLPEELARRRRQKELRGVALKLRGKGEEYNAKRFRRQAARHAAAAAGGVPDNHKPRRASVVQLILIPIFWNRKEEEKAEVLRATAAAQAVLRAADVACDTDTTHKLTPGQKYRHWEERGVMLRVEVGPQEARDGTCLFAHCRAAGEVAQKQALRVGPPLLEAVLAALGVPAPAAAAAPAAGAGTAAAGAAAGEAAEAPRGKKQQQKKGKGQGQGEEDVAAPAAAASPAADSAAGKVSSKKKSGDELEGDFEGAALLGQDAGGKKRKGKRGAQGEAEPVAALPAADEAGGGRAARSKRAGKVVKF